VVDRFVSYKTSPAHAPGDPGAVIRYDREGEVEMVNLNWGFAPVEPGGRPLTLLRSEGGRFGARRCLVPASEFRLSSGEGKTRRRWRFDLVTDDYFYFAGVWRPAQGNWPASYAILTIEANPDVRPYKERQNAVILRKDRRAWLDHELPQHELLKPLPKGTFGVEQVDGPPLEEPLFDWTAPAAA
jgi:putative SOS response-associated peptidase YedK